MGVSTTPGGNIRAVVLHFNAAPMTDAPATEGKRSSLDPSHYGTDPRSAAPPVLGNAVTLQPRRRLPRYSPR